MNSVTSSAPSCRTRSRSWRNPVGNIFIGDILIGVIIVAALGLLASSCQATPEVTLPVNATIGQMAGIGQTIYADTCARCHGKNGEGLTAAPLIGEEAHLHHFEHADGLLEYIKVSMPFDDPGSLSNDHCNCVTCYLLVENGLAEPDSVFTLEQLGGIHFEEELHAE